MHVCGANCNAIADECAETGDSITVIKNDHTGREAWRYDARVLARYPDRIVLEGFFDIPDRDDGYFIWQQGDRMVETFYTDRWYNVFEVHDRETDKIRAYYCNITRPTVIVDGRIVWDDLSVDYFIYEDGRTLILDREEFDSLPLSDQEREQAKAALSEIQRLAAAGDPPFDGLV